MKNITNEFEMIAPAGKLPVPIQFWKLLFVGMKNISKTNMGAETLRKDADFKTYPQGNAYRNGQGFFN